ncbi:MAG: LysE family translocator [Humibacillus sp.]|nr:LysE family translocator [Humibacillus sp.]MDN5779189.1 LysE family translocator [Humibacillus sp.]
MTATPVSFAFVVATAALLAVPGPSVVFVVTRALSHGRTAGFVCLVGLEAGLAVHVVLATAGVGAVLATSGTALTALRAAGVAYLLYLGLRQVLSSATVNGPTAAAPTARWTLARDAFVVDLLNPQMLLLLVAFLPQFTSRQQAATPGSLALVGGCVLVLAVICDSAWIVACTSGFVRRSAAARWPWSDAGSRRPALATGAIYLGLAGWAALS